ncbi:MULTISPECIES: hypothetical protein [Spirulina sp. CCY15215]|uniref:hypothetical protein n=1 Tax=Spirulina sp. CCY15215 TaxID=2767591 RepID=UPI0019517E4A|nr:hypothetical protein [Spirulina major]
MTVKLEASMDNWRERDMTEFTLVLSGSVIFSFILSRVPTECAALIMTFPVFPPDALSRGYIGAIANCSLPLSLSLV